MCLEECMFNIVLVCYEHKIILSKNKYEILRWPLFQGLKGGWYWVAT